MTKQKTEIFYSYRYRTWDSNVYYGNGSREFSNVQIQSGWGAWETIDEKKYNEILTYISGSHPSHYQAQRIQCEIQEDTAFDPRHWIAKQHADQDRDRKHLKGKERKTIYLVKRPEPDGGVSPWLMITCKEFEAIQFRTYPDVNVITSHAAQAHYGTISEYQYNGTTQFAFEFHPDFASMEPKS
jgi:hypothetical protein